MYSIIENLKELMHSDNFKLINLTPHKIDLIDKDNKVILSIKPESKPARCEELKNLIKDITIDNKPISLYSIKYKEVLNLPEEDKTSNKLYLVSTLCAENIQGRKDIVVPLDLVRDKEGNIVGCRSLGKLNSSIEESYNSTNLPAYFKNLYNTFYTVYKKNPSTLNKGKLEMLEIIMEDLIGQRSTHVKNISKKQYNDRKS